MSKKGKTTVRTGTVVVALLAIFIVPVIALTWLVYDIKHFMATPMTLPADGMVLKVETGSNLTRIANQLGQQKVLAHPRYLLWYARWSSQSKKIHVGEYELKSGDTPLALLDKIAKGDVIQYSLTIVEGWTFEQMLDAISRHPHIQHTLQQTDNDYVMQQLGFSGKHPEGLFMPDTYHFPRDEKDVAILKRAYQAMEKYLEQKWQDRKMGLPIKTSYEALILASIVEKETGRSFERPAIAGVFTRRLIKRMRLQSDPTTIYGMGKRYKGNIKSSHLLEETPYNTYKIFGLPPTPIAMPGRKAIDAVMHPLEGDALYFVAKGDGSHQFSATLEDHNKAVIKYQLKGRQKNFSSFKQAN